MSLNSSIPVYVTRKTADGDIASYSQSIWMTIIPLMLVSFNLIVWGFIGLVEAVKVTVGWF